MCDKAGISGNYTNHSLRSTGAMALFQAGVPERDELVTCLMMLCVFMDVHCQTSVSKFYRLLNQKVIMKS